MGSLQSKTEGSPAPEATKVTPFERLLPVVLPYPLIHNINIVDKDRSRIFKYKLSIQIEL